MWSTDCQGWVGGGRLKGRSKSPFLFIYFFLTICDPMDYSPPASSVHGDSPGKNTGVGCHFLLQGIFPSQGLDPGLLHCRQIIYCLSHQGSSFRHQIIIKYLLSARHCAGFWDCHGESDSPSLKSPQFHKDEKQERGTA